MGNEEGGGRDRDETGRGGDLTSAFYSCFTAVSQYKRDVDA